MAQAHPAGTLTLLNGDLTVPESYDEAFEGAHGVVHSAAVVEMFEMTDAQRRIVEPHVEGTRNVLNALDRSSTVKRLVHTSSIAAVQSCDKPDGHTFSEGDWNVWSQVENGDPYGYAKTQAERLVHDHVQGRPYDYAVVNPGVVLGPCLAKAHTKASVILLRNMVFGNEVNSWFATYVDVRDTAEVHCEALVRPEAAGQRFVTVAKESAWVTDLVGPLQQLFPEYKIDAKTRPGYQIALAKFLFNFGLILTPFQRHMLDRKYFFDNSRVRDVLGVEFRDFNETLRDSVVSMVDGGWVKPRPKK
jgi:nucleoside-diphosphate-sugar epimerase